MSALAGKRVLVTRAREQAEKTAALLRGRGAEPVLLPSIEIHPPSDVAAVAEAIARARAGHYAWVVFTSANGVEWTWRALEGGELGAAKIAVIGRGTEEALVARGAKASVVASESKGEGLAAAMVGELRAGERVLLLRALVARDVFPETLRAAGYAVDAVAVYETHAAEGPEVERVAAELGDGGIDVVTFTSASTVDSFVGLMGGEERAKALLGRTVVGSIGPVTTAALEARGLRTDVTATETTLEGLLQALEAFFQAPAGPAVP